ncbi:M23 family metallopeptidase [Nocardia sp. N13]|uniref:M23 family metallopeptidase n=1 Tax=Nocardioides sp. N13(2025) TaxID=3453405 RepID=UPI003F767F8F
MRALPVVLSGLVLGLLLGVSGPVHAGREEPRGVWPLLPEPDVVRPFERPPGPYSAGHRGVDLAGSPGQPVLAALEGTVGFAGSIGGKPVVTVLHGGRRTTYEPVVATVEPGQQVTAGDVLGRLVTVDGHCFPDTCLHWGLIEGETYVDPLTLVGGGPVRLLPLWRDEPVTLRLPWTPPLERWRPQVDFLV